MTQLTARLEELKKLTDSATEGPWEWVGSDLWGKDNDEVLNFECYTSFGLSGASPILESTDENRAFIAQSRELVPRLIEALEMAIQQRDELIMDLADYRLDKGSRMKRCRDKEIEAILTEGEGEE